MTAQEFKEQRQRLGLTQKQLAQYLGVPRNTVARWERGEMAIRHAEMIRMSLDRIAAGEEVESHA